MNNKINGRNGFTLIELLVVVLIIGILAAVALPQYQKAVEKTRLNAVVSTISQLQKGIDIWLLENGGYPSTQIKFLGGTSAYETGELSIDVKSRLSCQDSNIGSFTNTQCMDSYGYKYRADCTSNSCYIEVNISDYPPRRWWSLSASKSKEEDDVWIKEYTDSTENGFSRAVLSSLEPQGWRSCC